LAVHSLTRSPSTIRRGLQGFLLRTAIFAVLSIAALPTWQAVSPQLCRISPPEQRFPGFTCTILASLSFVLWLGPVGFIMGILSWETPLVVARLASGLLVALLSASLFLALGRRRGLIVFLLSFFALVGILAIVAVPFAVWQRIGEHLILHTETPNIGCT
jgi:hypothetical protein